jgi:hypothetical protein
MNTPSLVSRNVLRGTPAQSPSITSLGSRLRQAVTRLFADSVVGNPLHEAWTADGEPLERVSPAELAASRRVHPLSAVNGHSR